MKISELKDMVKKVFKEMSMTSTGAAEGGDGKGEQYFPPVIIKKSKTGKKERKDVEPKLAAGKVKNNYAVSHFGFEEAPSIPNRKSKSMDYKKIWEGLDIDDRVKVVYGNEFYGETGTIVDIMRGFAVIEMDRDGKEYSMHMSDVEKIDDEESWEVDEVYDKSKSKTNADELARVEDYLKSATTSQKSPAEARIKRLKLLVALEKKYNITLPVLHYGTDWSEYLKKQDVKTSRELEDKLSSKKETVNEESLEEINVPDNIQKFAKRKGITATVNKVAQWAEKMGKRIVGGTAIGKNYDTLILDLTYQGGEIYIDCNTEEIEVKGEPVSDYISFVSAAEENETLNENYARFRNQTSKRNGPEQLHKAVQEIKKKLYEVNRLLEYTEKLKSEISEISGEVKYKVHTERALEQITEMIKQTYIKSKKLK